MQKVISAAAVAITLAFSPLALANKSDAGIGEHISLGSERGAVTAEMFGEWRGKLVGEIETGETYSEITSMQKRDVIASLDRIGLWLDAAGSIDAMNEDQRVRVFNEQEKINEILTGVAADSRMVCTRDQTVGTRMRQTSCFTAAERRRRRDRDTEEAQRWYQGQSMR